jgi:hypothetical protein
MSDTRRKLTDGRQPVGHHKPFLHLLALSDILHDVHGTGYFPFPVEYRVCDNVIPPVANDNLESFPMAALYHF